MNKITKPLLLLTSIIIFNACSTTYQIAKELKEQEKSNSYFKGFVLYNPASNKTLINHNGAKFFTPASNTKLYTFYTAYRTFKDSVKALEYKKIGDSLLIKGTADPSLFYSFDSTKVVNFLKKDTAKIYLVDAIIDEPVYGSGWAWDDYAYYYQAEKSLFPVYGNIVTYGISDGGGLQTIPNYFTNEIRVLDSVQTDRDLEKNQFYLSKYNHKKQYVPFKTSNNLVAKLLSEAINKEVTVVKNDNYDNLKPLYSIPYDSLYKQMLVVSDNFIAEQLMLQVGDEVAGKYSVTDAIDYSLTHYLNDLPQKPRWVDGSGLSRYNLFTPQDMVHLLTKMYREIPKEKLLSYFPVGGESGTLKNWYGNDKPFVFAKSGSLSNNYNLSGYIITKKGNLLIFSSMNNHYKIPTSQLKKNVEDTLLKIYNNY